MRTLTFTRNEVLARLASKLFKGTSKSELILFALKLFEENSDSVLGHLFAEAFNLTFEGIEKPNLILFKRKQK